MSTFVVSFISEFKGEQVVLAAMDQQGLTAIRAALVASKEGSVSKIIAGTLVSEVRPEPGQATIDLTAASSVWRLSLEKINEIVEKLDAMQALPGPCHHYVEIEEPVKTLVLAKDEYLSH